MITVENVLKEFQITKKESGLKGTIKSLFKKEITIKKAVNDISFQIEEGEIVGYIGANGAGKSTTIKMMTGILVPTSGKITVNGLVPYENRQKNAQQIGVVFGQRTQLWWNLPLSETYQLLKEIYNVSDEDYNRRMEFFNQILELEGFMNNTVRTLSLGQRMRADLAASLLHNPKILFLDEPTIGLDIVVKEKVLKAIKEINEEFQTTVILTTHDMSDIEELCDRMIIIDEGKKVYDGSIEKIKGRYGYMRRVEIDVKNSEGLNSINIEENFNLKEEDLISWIEENRLHVKFNRKKINISEIVAYVMSKLEVIDITIKETNIEEIIKRIYNKEEV
ncbi:ABC transporter ATP-binding protein [Halonatronum saccharophilum]|uniref:ABC transporter ATP-binding protein n=1 Tax=Halonatronum saccharophilum TaxID=150060 RepID=UPI000483229C|nr:ATP-binding cassette domain-containing protein [Halonatronum saccharophilum]